MNHFKLKPKMRAMSTEQTLDKENLMNEKSSFTPFSCHADSHLPQKKINIKGSELHEGEKMMTVGKIIT